LAPIYWPMSVRLFMNLKRKNNFLGWGILLLIFLGSLSWSLTMIKSGWIYRYGMGFWGPNGHDGLWHIALINQLRKFSLNHPTFAGAQITNYHFGFDFLAAIINLLTGVPVVNLYFQVIPPVLAVLTGLLTYKFVIKWTKSERSAWWSVFFVYFGGSWGWLVSFIRNKTWGGESMFWANQAVSSLINPPYALSLVIILAGLIKLLDYLKEPTGKNLFFTSLLFGILVQVKVYAGIITLGSLSILPLYLILKKERRRELILTFLLSLLIAVFVFFPFNPEAKGLLVFKPFWFIRSMLFARDRFFFPKLEEARQVYWANRYWLKWLMAEFLGLIIFLVGNLGTRVIGIRYFFTAFKDKKTDKLHLMMVLMILISLVGTLFFVQKGNPWNTIQFFYYTQFLFSILAGVAISSFIDENKNKKLKLRVLSAAILVILTVPTTIISLKNDYLPARPPARISIAELEALNFLKKQPEGIVLSYPFDEKMKDFYSIPKPIFAYETTAYISAITEKSSFLADEMNLIISQYPLEKRKDEIARFFLSKDQNWGREFIKINNISYIYLVKGQKMEFGEGDIGFKKIFDNLEIKIYKLIE